jgi:hypothetical protein
MKQLMKAKGLGWGADVWRRNFVWVTEVQSDSRTFLSFVCLFTFRLLLPRKTICISAKAVIIA